MAFELSRIDRIEHTSSLAKAFPGRTLTSVSVAILPVRVDPTVATVWFPVTVVGDGVTAVYAGPDADSSGGAIPVPASADLWAKLTDSPEVDAQKVERITVLGGGTFTAPPSVQALIGLDTDGVPFYDPGGIGTPAALSLDADGVLYFTP